MAASIESVAPIFEAYLACAIKKLEITLIIYKRGVANGSWFIEI